MPRPRPDTPTRSLGWCLAPAAAAILAMASLALAQKDPAAAAETGYLTLATGIVLLAAAAVAGRPSVEGGAGPLLVAAATWALPAGPTRGAVAVALAAATLAVATGRWLPRGPSNGRRPDRRGDEARDRRKAALPGADAAERLAVVPVVALSLGLQALLRGEELLAAGGGWAASVRPVTLFVVFPLVGAAAVLLLAPLHGSRRALLVGAAVLAAGTGFRPATLAALLALAALPWALAPGAASLLRRRSGRELAVRGAALAVVALPFAWDARAAGVGALAGLSAAAVGAGRRRGLAWVAPALTGVAAGAVWLLPAGPIRLAPGLLDPGQALALAALVPLAVPALALPDRWRAPLALAALFLGLAAARGVAMEGALAAAVGLAALAVPRRGPVAAVQGAWSASLLGFAALTAGYPWLRPRALPAALEVLGIDAGWPVALGLVAGAAALAAGGALASRLRPAGGGAPASAAVPAVDVRERVALAATLAVVGLLVLVRVPAGGIAPVRGAGRVLDAERPSWSPALAEAGEVRTLVVDSALSNAAGLPEGTPVATLRLGSRGGPPHVWTLRAGRETGEWSAARAGAGPAPDAWSSWVAEEGTFFARRYRAVRRLPGAVTPERLELARRSDLPPEVDLILFHLELRP